MCRLEPEERRKVFFTNGMNPDKMIIITDAPKEKIEAFCRHLNQEMEDGENTYFDFLKKDYYVNVLFDSEFTSESEDIDVIGYDECYDFSDYPADGRVRFDSAQAMLSYLQSAHDLYNPETHHYVWLYNEAGSIAVDRLSKDDVFRILDEKDAGDSWSGYISGGSDIWDDVGYDGCEVPVGRSNLDYCMWHYTENWVDCKVYECSLLEEKNNKKEEVLRCNDEHRRNITKMEFQHSPREMAEKLMEFIRDFSDDEKEMAEETDYVAELFEKLQKSEEYNALVHRFDLMFMYEQFKLEDKPVMDGVTIEGVLFKHGTADYGLWEGFTLSEEDENAIQQILSKYDTEGCSVRGTRKEIADELGGSGQFTDDELYLLSDGMLKMIQNANEAARLVPDMHAQNALKDAAGKYKELNDKICMLLK